MKVKNFRLENGHIMNLSKEETKAKFMNPELGDCFLFKSGTAFGVGITDSLTVTKIHSNHIEYLHSPFSGKNRKAFIEIKNLSDFPVLKYLGKKEIIEEFSKLPMKEN